MLWRNVRVGLMIIRLEILDRNRVQFVLPRLVVELRSLLLLLAKEMTSHSFVRSWVLLWSRRRWWSDISIVERNQSSIKGKRRVIRTRDLPDDSA